MFREQRRFKLPKTLSENEENKIKTSKSLCKQGKKIKILIHAETGFDDGVTRLAPRLSSARTKAETALDNPATAQRTS